MSGQALLIGSVAALALGSAVFFGSGLSDDRTDRIAVSAPVPDDIPTEPVAVEIGAPGADPVIGETSAPDGEEVASAEITTPLDESSAEPEATPNPPLPGPPAPSLGLVRVDPAGGALVAGEGAPGSDMVLRLDGEEIARVQADARGGFVAMFDLPSSEKARLLTLESQGPDGLIAAAAESIVVAPVYPAAPAPETPPVQTSRPAQSAIADRDMAAAASGPTSDASPSEVASAAPPVGQRGQEEDTPAAPAVLLDEAPVDVAPAPIAPTAPGTALAQSPPVSGSTGSAAAEAAPAAPAAVASAADTQPSAPRLFRVGPQGLTVETGAAPSRPDAVQSLGIDVISYDAAGGVQLAGRGAGDQELRIFLDDRPVRRVRTGSDGAWVSPLPEVDAGTYTLRIETVSADGTVTGRLETPFRRTAPEIAAQARRDGAEAITVQTGYTLWALSEGYFGDGTRYVQLFEANRDQIRDPDLIFPGQIFTLPAIE